jgi:hypothetical protein
MKHLLIWGIILVTVFLLLGCSSAATDGDGAQGPVYMDELNKELTDPRLLQKLGVEGVVILEVETYHVTIAESGTVEPIGELYYTIQDGWHLKAENEILEFLPGEGWIIAEQ